MLGGALFQYCAELEIAKELFSIVSGWMIGANVDEHEINVTFQIDDFKFFMDISLAPETVSFESMKALMKTISDLVDKQFEIHELEQMSIDPHEVEHAVHYVHTGPMWRIVLRSPSVIV